MPAQIPATNGSGPTPSERELALAGGHAALALAGGTPFKPGAGHAALASAGGTPFEPGAGPPFKPGASSDAWRLARRQFQSRPALAITLTSVVSLLLGMGILLLSRRLLGASDGDLPLSTLLFTAVVVTCLLVGTRIAWRRNFPTAGLDSFSVLDAVIGWGSSLALICLAVGCSYPGYRTCDWLIWLPVLVADQLWRQSFFARLPLPTTTESTLNLLPQATTQPPQPPSAKNLTTPEGIVQQLFRVREDEGQEVIYGTLRADFQPGQRLAVVHAGFCPPLSYLPEIEADPLPGYPTRIKVVQALAHGVRLDVRLTAPAEEDCHVWIDMAARPGSHPPRSMRA